MTAGGSSEGPTYGAAVGRYDQPGPGWRRVEIDYASNGNAGNKGDDAVTGSVKLRVPF